MRLSAAKAMLCRLVPLFHSFLFLNPPSSLPQRKNKGRKLADPPRYVHRRVCHTARHSDPTKIDGSLLVEKLVCRFMSDIPGETTLLAGFQ